MKKNFDDNYIDISFQKMLDMNSYLESKNKWDIASKHGYLGKYQIGKLALLDLGYDKKWIDTLMLSIKKTVDTTVINKDTIIYKCYTFDISLFTPKKQNEVILKMLKKTENVYLKKHIKKYTGKLISGVRITKAGILSASFLGFESVKIFLESNGKINPKDGNGHSIKDRLKYFEKYELN